MALESLQEILARKNFSPSDEAKLIKDYVQRRYQSKCSVMINKSGITVIVASSSLAGSLQMEKPKLIKACGLKGKLFIRTGRFNV